MAIKKLCAQCNENKLIFFSYYKLMYVYLCPKVPITYIGWSEIQHLLFSF